MCRGIIFKLLISYDVKMKKIIIFVLLASLEASANSSFGNQVITAVTIHDSGNLMVTLKSVSHKEECADEDRKNTVILNLGSPYQK